MDMKKKDFQEMKSLVEEIDRDVIYKTHTGVYNFQKLEKLLIKHKLMVPYYEKIFAKLKKQRGISDEDFKENSASDLETLSEKKYSYEERFPDLKESILAVIKSAYEEFVKKGIEKWYKWAELLAKKKISINLSNGWEIKYRTDIQGLQLKKGIKDKVISILGPCNSGGNEERPFFELCVIKKEYDTPIAEFVDNYDGYRGVMSDVKKRYSEKSPFESEIEKAITSLDKNI